MKTSWNKNTIITWEGERTGGLFPGNCASCKSFDESRKRIDKPNTGHCLFHANYTLVKKHHDCCGWYEQSSSGGSK